MAGSYYSDVVDKLRGALRATLLIENARGYPNFHVVLLPESATMAFGHYKVHLGNPGVGGGTHKIDYPAIDLGVDSTSGGSNSKKTRWRLDYIGPSGVYASFEERVDKDDLDGKKFSHWKCHVGKFFEHPPGQAKLSDAKLKKGVFNSNNGPVARENIFQVGGEWQRSQEPFSNNYWLYNSDEDSAIDNVVAITY